MTSTNGFSFFVKLRDCKHRSCNSSSSRQLTGFCWIKYLSQNSFLSVILIFRFTIRVPPPVDYAPCSRTRAKCNLNVKSFDNTGKVSLNYRFPTLLVNIWSNFTFWMWNTQKKEFSRPVLCLIIRLHFYLIFFCCSVVDVSLRYQQ